MIIHTQIEYNGSCGGSSRRDKRKEKGKKKKIS